MKSAFVILLLLLMSTVSQAQAPSTAATAFREGRDLIKEGEWQKAEAQFNRFINQFPQDRELPAAIYWLAFSLKQQSKFAAADGALTRLIEFFPASTWTTDARAMRVEIAPRLKNSQVIEQGVTEPNEEIRLAALQSLFESRPERAIVIAADILKAGSGSSRSMKEGAIALLADSETLEAIPVLMQVAQTDNDLRLRRKAIEGLEEFEDEPVIIDELIKLFTSQNNDQIRESVLEILEDIEQPRAVEALIQLYDMEKGERMKEDILEALAETEQTAALRKLTQVAASDPSLKLRRKALELIGESEDPEALKFLEEILKKN